MLVWDRFSQEVNGREGVEARPAIVVEGVGHLVRAEPVVDVAGAR